MKPDDSTVALQVLRANIDALTERIEALEAKASTTYSAVVLMAGCPCREGPPN